MTDKNTPALSAEQKKELTCGMCLSPAKDGEKLKLCANCGTARYCSTECQKKGWKLHKPECEKITGMKKVADRVQYVTKKLIESWNNDISRFKHYCRYKGVSLKRSVFTVLFDDIIDIHDTTDVKQCVEAINKDMTKALYHQWKSNLKSEQDKEMLKFCDSCGYDTFILVCKSRNYAHVSVLKIS